MDGSNSTGGEDRQCSTEDKNVYTVMGALLDHQRFRTELSREGISNDEFRQKVRDLLQIEIGDEQIKNLKEKVIPLVGKTCQESYYAKIRC